MKIVILGAGGFVGSNLVEHLLEHGAHEIVGVDLVKDKLAHVTSERFDFRFADVRRDLELLDDLIEPADLVVNLVATTTPAFVVRAPLDVIDVMFVANYGIAQRCAASGTRLIHYSTCEIYGHPSGTSYDEHSSQLRLGPVHKTRWAYAAAEQLVERAIHGLGIRDGLDFTVLRPFNLIGPRCDQLVPAGTRGGPRLLAQFMSALVGGGPLYLVDGGRRHRTFTHIADANRAFDVILDHPEARGGTFNVGNPANHTTVRAVAELMRKLYEELTGGRATSDLIEIEGTEFYGEGFDDADRVPPDISRLGALGWAPRHGLAETFRDAMTSYL